MGGAGGKGCAPPIGTADPQDGSKDVKIRDYNGQATDNQDGSSHNENQQFIDAGVSTYQRKKGGHVTEEMVDNVGATKGKPESSCCMSHGAQEPNSIGSNHQLYAKSLRHGNGIQQRITDGHIVVTGHGRQQKTLDGHKESKEPLLPSAAQEGDGLPFSKEVTEHPGTHH